MMLALTTLFLIQATQPTITTTMLVQLVSASVMSSIATVAGIKAASTYFPGVDLFFSSKKTKKERGVTCNFCPESEATLSGNNDYLKTLTGHTAKMEENLLKVNETLANSTKILAEVAEISKQLVKTTSELVFNAAVDKEVRKRIKSHQDS